MTRVQTRIVSGLLLGNPRIKKPFRCRCYGEAQETPEGREATAPSIIKVIQIVQGGGGDAT